MLGAKAYAVDFKLKGERARVKPPRSHVVLHDPDGITWPKCSVLIGDFERLDEAPGKIPDWARDYFGKTYEPRKGRVESLPPRRLSDWQELGELKDIRYIRRGNRFGERGFFHPFGKRRWQSLFITGRAVLYKHSSWYRIEFPDGCLIDDRGFVWP